MVHRVQRILAHKPVSRAALGPWPKDYQWEGIIHESKEVIMCENGKHDVHASHELIGFATKDQLVGMIKGSFVALIHTHLVTGIAFL